MLSFSPSLPVLPGPPLSSRPGLSTRPAPVALAGFGSRSASPAPGGGGKRPPKRQRKIRATYLDLMRAGAAEFVCYARAEGSGDAGWRRVGLVVAEGDNVCVAMSNNKRAVLEHAKRLHPQLGMVKVLEVGFSKDGGEGEGEAPAVPEVCGRSEETCTSAFSPDAVAVPFYVRRLGDGRAAPIDTKSLKRESQPGGTFPPRGKGEGKTPSD